LKCSSQSQLNIGSFASRCRINLTTFPLAHRSSRWSRAETEWNLFLKESPRRVKPLLYVYRVLLTGIHLMRTGEVEANLLTLNEDARLSFIPDLVARKLAGPEKSTLDDADLQFHESQYQKLRAHLQSAFESSSLAELPSDETRRALNDLLIRLRLNRSSSSSKRF
jgi:uncharacterized protein